MNYLSFRLVDSPSFKGVFAFVNPHIKLLSRRTLCRDIVKGFQQHRELLKAELKAHAILCGGLSLATDAWSARNRDEHAAVTIDWINEMWEQREVVLDVIYLQIAHTGQYLGDKLLEVTDDFEITHAGRTISRNNAYTNDAMLKLFETAAAQEDTRAAQL